MAKEKTLGGAGSPCPAPRTGQRGAAKAPRTMQRRGARQPARKAPMISQGTPKNCKAATAT
eukprot:6038830-Alexandrium_andersonii.AAC.1